MPYRSHPECQKVPVAREISEFLLSWSNPSDPKTQLDEFMAFIEEPGSWLPTESNDLAAWGAKLSERFHHPYKSPVLTRLQNQILGDPVAAQCIRAWTQNHARSLLRIYRLGVHARYVNQLYVGDHTEHAFVAQGLTLWTSVCAATLGGVATWYYHQSFDGAWVGVAPPILYLASKWTQRALWPVRRRWTSFRASRDLERLRRTLVMEFR